MGVNIRRDDAGIEISPTGNLDTKGSGDLQKAMDEIFKGEANVRIVINLSAVPFLSSAGLRVLLLAMKKLNNAGGSMELVNANDSIKEVFNMTGFSSILKIM
ncbi:MAG: STAS domain-containing protein [Synergistaceae bacterium]|jgi:anti-anti-sigma factor|nr:STAS domain-containing protein [Synergistaceae bacterium]